MKIRILGSGTLVPDALRGSSAHWVEVGGASVLMDCGAGTLRTLASLGLEWGNVTHILLSHFHTDHTGELAPLLFALKHGLAGPRETPLCILGPVGLEDFLHALEAAHGPHMADPGFPLVAYELPSEQEWRDPEGRFLIKTLGTRHTSHSLAYRLESGDGCLGYTGDTGPDPALGPFFLGCHVLIAECSFPDGQEMDNHLTPGGLSALVEIARPDLLVPVHAYPPLTPEDVPGLLERAGYGGRVLTGWDGLGIDLAAGNVAVLETPDS